MKRTTCGMLTLALLCVLLPACGGSGDKAAAGEAADAGIDGGTADEAGQEPGAEGEAGEEMAPEEDEGIAYADGEEEAPEEDEGVATDEDDG